MPQAMLRIGDFARLTRLSPKALRLYDDLGLLVPVRVDPTTGYRLYSPAQINSARIVALLRSLHMPLSTIAEVGQLPAAAAAAAVRRFWAERERSTAVQAFTAAYVSHLLEKGTEPMNDNNYDMQTRTVGDRSLLAAVRYVHEADAGATMGELLGQMRAAGPGLSGVEGCPFIIFHGEVSADSDGPMEMVRPVANLAQARAAATALGDVQCRQEPTHDEAFVRLTLTQARWPAHLAVLDALQAKILAAGRTPAGPPRQVMIADWRTVGDDVPACDLAVPLRQVG